MPEADFIWDLRFEISLLISEPPRIASRLSFDCRPTRSLFGLEVNGRRVQFSENVFDEFSASGSNGLVDHRQGGDRSAALGRAVLASPGGRLIFVRPFSQRGEEIMTAGSTPPTAPCCASRGRTYATSCKGSSATTCGGSTGAGLCRAADAAGQVPVRLLPRGGRRGRAPRRQGRPGCGPRPAAAECTGSGPRSRSRRGARRRPRDRGPAARRRSPIRAIPALGWRALAADPAALLAGLDPLDPAAATRSASRTWCRKPASSSSPTTATSSSSASSGSTASTSARAATSARR